MPFGAPVGAMDDPSGVLRSEHEAISHLLDSLDGIAGRIRADDVVPKDDLLDAMIVASDFADRCHQGKEEDVLFPALVKASPRGPEIVGRLTAEHMSLRKLIDAIRMTIPDTSTRKAARKSLVRSLTAYSKLLREHMRLEHQVLLPEVERAIPKEERARIAQAFVRVERDIIGLGMHAAYDSIIQRLAAEYRRAPQAAVV